MPVGLANLLQEWLDRFRTALGSQQWRSRLARTQQRRDDDLVKVLITQLGTDAFGLYLAALGERWIDNVEPVTNPFGLAVADEDEFHGTDDGTDNVAV